jgi:hypothetical protein
VYWTLTAAFLLSAALNLLHVRGGILTNYLADLTLPALLYVVSRDGGGAGPFRPLMHWLGKKPERAAAFFFLASAATELTQIVWPHGLFAGRFDPWDIAAYALGLIVVYLIDIHRGAG